MTYQVAVLGAGIGVQHISGLLQLTDRFQVRTVCDLNKELAEAQANRTGAKFSTSISEVLRDPEIDIVDICLPPRLHVPIAMDALAAGKHVVVEKPLAGSVADADRLCEAERKTEGKIFPVFQYRYGHAFRQLQALKDAGLLGAPRVASLETHWNRKADYYATPWRGTLAHELGGAVLSHAIHIHDLISTQFGRAANVSALLNTSINAIETEDCAAIAMRMETGALVTSSVTLGAADDTSRLKMVFQHATAESKQEPYAPGEANWTFTARDADRQNEIDNVVRATSQCREGFAGYFEAIADHLDGRPSPVVSLSDGLAAVELATAIYLADRTGERVVLPLDRSLPICRGWGDLSHATVSS
ncbi:Gfo/Idh/MocA family protein [Roseibium album]|uniref:Gfo/Idh/MocA family protein n=1 Tax=Roseibium album TaxID=311410 RepID=UPI00249344C3|nr:Gfo/Idh/MocA family oxidoreductase [Roseibium album]